MLSADGQPGLSMSTAGKLTGLQWPGHAASRHLVGTTMCSLHKFLRMCLHNIAGIGQHGEAALQLSRCQLQGPSQVPVARPSATRQSPKACCC